MLVLALLAAATATVTPLSGEGRALLCASPVEGPEAPQTVARLLAKQQPGAETEIETLTAVLASTGKCPDPPPPPEPTRPKSAIKGSLEFGLGQSSGTTDSANANIAGALEAAQGRWSQRLRATLDYQDIEGIAASERYTANWDLKHTLSKNAFVTGIATFESDRLAGFRARTTQSVGFGAKFGIAPALTLDLSGGPSWRQVKWVGDRGKEAQLGARGSAALNWTLAPGVSFAASGSGIFEAASGTIEGQAAITGKLLGPLATRLQLTARHETNPYPGVEPTTTTSRASIVYNF